MEGNMDTMNYSIYKEEDHVMSQRHRAESMVTSLSYKNRHNLPEV